MIRLSIDDDCMWDEALAWWKSLDPGTRAVYLQAIWEGEGCPEAPKHEPKQPTKPRAMSREKWEARVRWLARESFTGQPVDIREIGRLRDVNPDEYDQISEEVRTQERRRLNPWS